MKEQITEEQIREALCLRHTEAVQKKLSAARTAVAGLGAWVPTSPFFWHGSEWDTCISLILTGWTFPT